MKRFIYAFVLGIVLLFSMPFSFAANSDVVLMEGVKVYIDGNAYQTENGFYNLNGSTLAPMRELFEKLGAVVDWDNGTRTAIATIDDLVITINIDTKVTALNGKVIEQKIKPQIINDSTYVPLRFIAESFDFQVDWNGAERTISIANLSEVEKASVAEQVNTAGEQTTTAGEQAATASEQQNTVVMPANTVEKEVKGDNYSSSEFFRDEYLIIDVINKEKLRIEGREHKAKTAWSIQIKKIDTSNAEEVFSDFREFDGHDFAATFDLSDKLESGLIYDLMIYFQEKEGDYFWSVYDKIRIRKENGELHFIESPKYATNQDFQLTLLKLNPENYLKIDINNAKHRREIEELAKEIVGDEQDDYQKLRLINDWVAENIYYDWDIFLSHNYGDINAYKTYATKKSVCQGYSELTLELLHSVGIPARLIRGYALGVGNDNRGWEDISAASINKGNHVWNEAYVNGRWVIVDTTWNTTNKYKNGKFEKGTTLYRYFDPSLKAFSQDHVVID